MDYNIFYDDKTNLKYIKFGKTQSFNNKKYIPIYYNDDNKKATKYNDFLIKTPRLFVPNKPRRETGYKPSIETIMIKSDDDGVLHFSKIIKNIQSKIEKQITRRKKLNLKDKEFLPIIRDDTKYKTEKMYLPLSIFTSSCIDINNKQIDEWCFPTPTYGYFIIQVKNVWISEFKWGINIYCNGAMILPSQLMDPPPIPVNEIKYMFESEIANLKTIGDSEEYAQYFSMKKMGVPIQAIKNKMLNENKQSYIIDLDASTPLSKIKIKQKSKSSNNSLPPPPPPPLPSSSISLNLVSNKKILSSSTLLSNKSSSSSLHSALFSELLTKKNNLLKKKNNNNKSLKIIKKDDNRIPSLDQIMNAINRMKSISSSNC